MKIGTRVIAYYLPSSEEVTEKTPKVTIRHGVIVDGNNIAFEDVERTDNESILVRFTCEEHPQNKTCNCENNVRSMKNVEKHLYEEVYYGGYYGQVIIVDTTDK